jgi:hypothetical protein
MVYMNMGHGDKIFDDPQQNKLFLATLLWLGSNKSSSTKHAHVPPS